MLRSIMLFLLLTTTTYGQITSEVLTGFSGLTEVRTIGNIVVGKKTEEIKEIQLGVITVQTKASIVEFEASDDKRRPVAFVLASDLLVDDTRTLIYTVTTPGTIYIDALCIDFKKEIYNKYKTVLDIVPPLPPTPPTPPVPPTPDVPTDVFDNIGQRVAVWTKDNPNNKIIGQLYLDASKELKTDLSLTINQAANNLITKLRASPAYTNYDKFKEGLNADAAARGVMTKGTLIEYWRCVALGFGVK